MVSWRPLLIVDDDVDHAVIARAVLASVAPDLTVDTCLDPRLALQRLADAPPSAIVLIDRMLDGVESLPMLRHIVRQRPDLYVVLLSSALSAEDQRRALSAGATEATEKPGGLEAWRALMRGILARAHPAGVESGSASDSRAG
jgi:DNA-binding response OmpR family regulator